VASADEPLVVEPHEEIGQYGGEWNSAILGVHDWPWLGRTVAYEPFVRWDPEWEQAVPNLAADWEYNDDATELTIPLREGVRWSDGEPFTADDVLFALNDIFNDHDLTPMAAANPGTGETPTTGRSTPRATSCPTSTASSSTSSRTRRSCWSAP
jgi:peptide/nickel transport system substrate-binding protein